MRRITDDKTAAVFYEVVEYIRANLGNPLLSQKDVSDHFYFSTSYFSTMFKRYVQQSFVIFLNGERISKAKKLLRDPELNIVSIAASCGFQNPSYFTRVFKKATGITPQDYRRRRALGQRDGEAEA